MRAQKVDREAADKALKFGQIGGIPKIDWLPPLDTSKLLYLPLEIRPFNRYLLTI